MAEAFFGTQPVLSPESPVNNEPCFFKSFLLPFRWYNDF